MYSISGETIYAAFSKLKSVSDKLGGLLCILAELPQSIKTNVCYEINSVKLKKSLNTIFDLEIKNFSDLSDNWFIVFANGWQDSVYELFIKEKVDLSAIAIFFLRRMEFQEKLTLKTMVEMFLQKFNLEQLKDKWFFEDEDIRLEYTQDNIESEQKKFYEKINITIGHKAIKFNGSTVAKSAAEFSSGAQIQPLYSSQETNICFFFTNKDLSNYYNFDKKTHIQNISVNENFPLILYGPPGTGKTYKMQHEYIDKFAKEDRFITTFHQSFSYEEFVEGLKPVLADKPDGDTSSDVKYKIEKGIFYKACERAAELAGYESKKDESETPLQKCIADVDRSTKMDEAIKENKIVLLCIDEINRANVSVVFGDLISLIEPSKRIGAKNEMVVSLPYSKEDFAVPANLMIVGTMNTADRSIQLLDSALRRRFRFEELLPDYNEIKNSEKAKSILNAINARIRCLLDKDHQIGHSYFIEAKNDLDIFNALKDSVIPLLEEYFYNDAQKIRQILNENDNTDNAFYIKDEEAENASKYISTDYDDEKAFHQLNPKLSDVKDEDSATSFISHIVPKSE